MPLKKPKELPKIPKTRKKNAEAALAAIPQKKPDKLEYYCKAFYEFDEVLKQQFAVLSIQTIVDFTSFAYEVSVEAFKDKDTLNLVIMGLSAKTNMVPQIQPARTDIRLDDLNGELKVNVVKQDGSINSAVYNLNVFKKEINLIKQFIPEKKNNRLFCQFMVEKESFTFGE